MEGKKEKVEHGIEKKNVLNVGIPRRTFIKSNERYINREYPQGEYPQDEYLEEGYPQEEYPQGEYQGEYPEEYPQGEYPEEGYSRDEDNVDDGNWEAEAGGSESVSPGGIYGLFKDVLAKPDSKKVSNLDKVELGNWNLSVRDCERIALIAETFHHPGVAKFFRKQSRVITDTAMSKLGWFSELFITSKRYASRDSSSSVSNLPQFNKKSKWRIFSEKEDSRIQGQEQ